MTIKEVDAHIMKYDNENEYKPLNTSFFCENGGENFLSTENTKGPGHKKETIYMHKPK